MADRSGTRRDEVFFTTDRSLHAAMATGRGCDRWNVETPVQECAAHLGLEGTRGWCRRTGRGPSRHCHARTYSALAWLW